MGITSSHTAGSSGGTVGTPMEDGMRAHAYTHTHARAREALLPEPRLDSIVTQMRSEAFGVAPKDVLVGRYVPRPAGRRAVRGVRVCMPTHTRTRARAQRCVRLDDEPAVVRLPRASH